MERKHESKKTLIFLYYFNVEFSSFLLVVNLSILLIFGLKIVICTGQFQGPALVAILEGVSLNREEVSSLQLLPPWRLRGNTLNYGLGLLSCFFVCDFLSVISGGHFYMFDPCDLALGVPSSHTPTAKMFSLIGMMFSEIRFNSFLAILSICIACSFGCLYSPHLFFHLCTFFCFLCPLCF